MVLVSASSSASAQRTVFAHFMLANQDYPAADAPGEQLIASYEREIQQAQAIGIDGFALNAGGWTKEPRYVGRAAAMFEAAYRLHSHFQLTFSADMCCSNGAEDVEDMVRRFANNRRYASIYSKRDGKFLLTTFAGTKKGPEFWQQIRHDLETGANPSKYSASADIAYAGGVSSSKPLPLFLVPAFFWGGELPGRRDIDNGLAAYKDNIDGAFYWGIAGVPGLDHPPDQIPSSDAYASVLHTQGKLYMAPICLQFWGANAGRYYEYSGYQGMRAMWMDAIEASHPEMVEIITWNDFVEGTYVSPVGDPAAHPGANDLGASAAPPDTRNYFHTHVGATDLLAYFIQWYKTGECPGITRDSIYWAYRTVEDVHRSSTPLTKFYGPVKDVVYVTANLTSAAFLMVHFGNVSRTVVLAAGSTDVQVPMVAGHAPTFELLRRHRSILRANGADAITIGGPYLDLYYSTGDMHD